MKGILYGIGVGPGDPELMTQKAVRLLREADVIAAPGEAVRESVAYQIAVQCVPELETKELLPLFMPMVMDRALIQKAHRQGADQIIQLLSEGKTVAFITLGDPTIYSTFSYVEKLVKAEGFSTVYVSGVPSFCAAAAALGVSLAEWQEPLHIFPAIHKSGLPLPEDGTCVLMKSGHRIGEIRELLKKSGREAVMAENCGMAGERLVFGEDAIPEDAGYLSLIIVGGRRL